VTSGRLRRRGAVLSRGLGGIVTADFQALPCRAFTLRRFTTGALVGSAAFAEYSKLLPKAGSEELDDKGLHPA